MKTTTRKLNFKLLGTLLIVLLLGNLSIVAAIPGAGTGSDPYLISTADDLVAFGQHPASDQKFYRLGADIDMTGKVYRTTNSFKGTFDGDGHVIKNLTISSADANVGFIANVNGAATIKNVGFENLAVNATGNAKFIGGIVGVASAQGLTIENCFVQGTVAAPNNRGGVNGVGGIVGKLNSATRVTIKNCYVEAAISSGGAPTAGIVGVQTVKNKVVNIITCVYYGPSAKDPVFGKKDSGTASQVYCSSISGTTTNIANATPIIELELSSSYVGFDFSDIWGIKDGKAKLQKFGAQAGETPDPDSDLDSKPEPPIATPTDSSRIIYMNIGAVDNTNNVDSFYDTQIVKLKAPRGDSLDYAFVGWFADAALTLAVDSPAIGLGAKNDTTFYAKWIESEDFRVTGISWDGSDATLDMTVIGCANLTVNVDYRGGDGSALRLLVSTKDDWEDYWLNEELTFAAGSTRLTKTITVPAVSSTPYNDVIRVMLSSNEKAEWKDRYDIDNDDDFSNDVLFAKVMTKEDFMYDDEYDVPEVAVYPNPNDGLFTLLLEKDAMVEIYSLTGNRIYSHNAYAGENYFDLSGHISGLYVMMIRDESTSQVVKVQIK